MQVDVPTLVLVNLIFSLRIAPLIVVGVTIIRTLILFTGQKREFEDWTRNPLMTFMTILFAIPSAVYFGIQYIVSRLFGTKVEGIGGSTTYGEVTLFLKVDKPPRVIVVLLSLFTTIIVSIFLALMLFVIPGVVYLDLPIALFCWYVAVGVLFNTSIRSGDLRLLLSALKKRPRSGIIELLTVMTALIVFYSGLMVVVA